MSTQGVIITLVILKVIAFVFGAKDRQPNIIFVLADDWGTVMVNIISKYTYTTLIHESNIRLQRCGIS